MTDSPQLFAQRPHRVDALSALALHTHAGDLLSGLLRTVRLRGGGAAELGPQTPFALAFGATTGTVHLFEHGAFTLQLAGSGDARAVRGGDIVLLPRPQRHVVASAGADIAIARDPERDDLTTPGGRQGEDSGVGPRWLAGSFTLDAPSGGALLTELPDVVVLSGLSERSLAWLQLSRRFLLEELGSPGQGSAEMISRILELLFVQIIRAWASRPEADPGWLTGASDPQIGRALAEIHHAPGRDWTVATLADLSHLSRSAFAQRFTERIGRAPVTYLAELRLATAAEQLRSSSDPVNVIAGAVGYRSSAAFTRAFAKRYGVSPTRWRARLGDDSA